MAGTLPEQHSLLGILKAVLTCRGLAVADMEDSICRRIALEVGMEFCVVPRHMTQESRIERVETVHKTPIMFYRPKQPSGGNYLKVSDPILMSL